MSYALTCHNIFRDGQVGTLVLRNMKYLASAELYQSLLEGESNFDLPRSWSVNVKEAPTLSDVNTQS